MNEDQKEEIMALEAILPPDEFSYDEDNFAGELRIVPRLGSDISVGIQGRSVSYLVVAKFKLRSLSMYSQKNLQGGPTGINTVNLNIMKAVW